MILRLSVARINNRHFGFVKIAGVWGGVFTYKQLSGFREWVLPNHRPLYWALLDEVILRQPARKRLRIVK